MANVKISELTDATSVGAADELAIVQSATTKRATAAELKAYVNASDGALAQLNTVGTSQIDNDAVTYPKIQNVSATDKVLGRSTSGAGDVEEIPCTAAGRALIDDADASAQRTTLGLGALATLATVGTAQIDADAVTYAKIQNVSATDRILGRDTSGAGDIEELTLSAVLDMVGSAAQGDILYRNASAWVRLAAGTDGHVLTSGGSGANPAWEEAAGGGGSSVPAAMTKLHSGGPAVTTPTAHAFGTGSISSNLIRLVPIFIGKGGTVNRIGLEVTTSAAGAVRLGIYANSNARPGTLVLDAGTIDVSSTGIKEITISQALSDNTWYWLAAVGNVSPSVRTCAIAAIVGFDRTSTGTSNLLYRSFTYAALPADESAETYDIAGGTNVPAIFVRIA